MPKARVGSVEAHGRVRGGLGRLGCRGRDGLCTRAEQPRADARDAEGRHGLGET